MSGDGQFELVEDRANTRSGFELSLNLARHSSARSGEISIIRGCATIGEFQEQLNRVIDELQHHLLEAEKRFGDGPYGPRPLGLD